MTASGMRKGKMMPLKGDSDQMFGIMYNSTKYIFFNAEKFRIISLTND